MVIIRNIKKKEKKKGKKGKNAKQKPRARPKKARAWVHKFFVFVRRALILMLIALIAGLAGFLTYRNRGYLLPAAVTVKAKVTSIDFGAIAIKWRPEKKTRRDTGPTTDAGGSAPETQSMPEIQIPSDTAAVDTTDTAEDAAAPADTAAADTTIDAHAPAAADTVENVAAADTVDSIQAPVSADTAAAPADDAPAPPAVPAISGIFTLQDVTCRLADRDDLRINMTVELFYDSEALRDELNFKRGALTTVVTDVMRRYEYGNTALPALRTDLLNAFNRILHDGQLSGIDIRNFRVESQGL